VYLEGRIRSNDYQDKEGIQRHSIEIVADNMTMLSGGRGEGNGQGGATSESATGQGGQANKVEMGVSHENEPDDLPF
jgi:single-strand DNA-binding protein